MDFKDNYQDYESILATLQKECLEAEKKVLVGETNLTNLSNQKDKLVKECEAMTGVPIDEVSNIIAAKEAELSGLMAKLSLVDINDPVTPEKLDTIKAIVSEFSLNVIK